MNVAFIPVRGGSKSIPLKNIKLICGKPLVYWTVKAACECEQIDAVYVATDNDAIRKCVEEFKRSKEAEVFSKLQVIDRSAESASDTASTEYAMLEFAANYEFDNIVLIQATSPLLCSDDLQCGFEAFREDGVDSVLSVAPQNRFYWEKDEKGLAHPLNYDIFHRPRRQDFDGCLVENGAFYITSKEKLIQTKNRLSGNIKAVEMGEDTFLELDEPGDWTVMEALMKKNGLMEQRDIPEIKMFLTDCDGCLTDGGMYYSENGDELKKFNTKDGMGFKLLREAGIVTGILTGEDVELNQRRAKKLRLDILEAGCSDKISVLKKLCKERNIRSENVCYIGDDINDLEVLKSVGYSCCPADAISQIKECADYVAKAKGGEGVIREVAERILLRY